MLTIKSMDIERRTAPSMEIEEPFTPAPEASFSQSRESHRPGVHAHHPLTHSPSPCGSSPGSTSDDEEFFTPPQTPSVTSQPPIGIDTAIRNLELALEQKKIDLLSAQSYFFKTQEEYERRKTELAEYHALRAYHRNQVVPPISRLPVELLIRIFAFIQNSVVASHVCSKWRTVALSSPRLWSSLHIHPSKGPTHLQTLLNRSKGQTIEICFCPLPNTPPPLTPATQLSLPPHQYQEDLILSPKVVSVLAPHVNRMRSFELNASIPGTWFTLLPVLNTPAPNLRHLQVSTIHPADFAQLYFFCGVTPSLHSVNITGAFPTAHKHLLSNLTLLRLEAVPEIYQPTTREFAAILRACPNLASLSLLDAGPRYDIASAWNSVTDSQSPIVLQNLQALAFRESHDAMLHEGSGWLLHNVSMPNLLSLHLMQVPGTTIAQQVPNCPSLQELYLWAPNCPTQDVINLLWKLPNLVSLELPSIKAPLDILVNLSSPQRRPITPEQMAALRSRLDAWAADPSRRYHPGQMQFPKGLRDENGKDEIKLEWLCPKLERFGMPYVRMEQGPLLSEALRNLWQGRNMAVTAGQLPHSIDSIIAPGGKPDYIRSATWEWLKKEFTIRSFADGNMDMLFDRLPIHWAD